MKLFFFFQVKIPKETKFIIFPYGSKRTKLTKHKQIHDGMDVAITTITKMTPDITVKLSSNVDQSNSQLSEFFRSIFATYPVKFPVIFFTGKLKLHNPKFHSSKLHK